MNKKNKEIWHSIDLAVQKAKKKHPTWPGHACGQGGIVMEEAGELMQACVQYKYERNDEKVQRQHMKDEAIHTAATAIRFLENLKD